jgi:hypothetical protein
MKPDEIIRPLVRDQAALNRMFVTIIEGVEM